MGLGIKKRLKKASRPIRTAAAERNIFLCRNDRRLWELRDKHKGEKCVLIGMGPSFQADDLDRFEGFRTFACNKIFLAMEGRSWSPDYYVVSDILVAENNKEIINSGRFEASQRIYPQTVAAELDRYGDPIIVQWTTDLSEISPPSFRTNLIAGLLGGGCTVVFEMIQLAYLMGFAEVYLVGIDFSFDLSAATGESSRSGDVLVSSGEKNHFHPDYRKPGETWTVPRIEEMRTAFGFASDAFTASGRKLINASRETKLEAIERMPFDSVFGGTR